MDVYELLRGPGAWIALVTCLGGTAARLILLVGRAKKIRRLHAIKGEQHRDRQSQVPQR